MYQHLPAMGCPVAHDLSQHLAQLDREQAHDDHVERVCAQLWQHADPRLADYVLADCGLGTKGAEHLSTQLVAFLAPLYEAGTLPAALASSLYHVGCAAAADLIKEGQA